MKRRSFFAFLAAPFAAAAADAPVDLEPYQLAEGQLMEMRTPKLRLWTLGSLEHNIVPNETAIRKLAEALGRWDKVSDLDLIWDETLKVTQLDLNANDTDAIAAYVMQADGSRTILQNPVVRVIPPKGGEA